MATLDENTAALTALSNEVTALYNMDDTSGVVVSLQTDVTDIKRVNNTQDSRLTNLETRVSQLEDAICLKEGTLILMADGSSKPIETIQPNEMIASWDLENQCMIPAKAYASLCTGRARQWRCFIFEDGSTIDISGSHQIYCIEKGIPYTSNKWEYGMHSIAINGDEIAYSYGTRENTVTMIPYRKFTLFCDTGLYFANGVLCGHRLGEAITSYYRRDGHGFALSEAEIAELTAYATEYDNAHSPNLRNPEFLKEALAQFKTRGTAEKQIEHFKKELSKRDYKTIKAAQGVLSIEEADANRVECEELRGHIAEQEVIAAAAEESIVALREKYGAKSSSFDAITKKQLREAARKARERYITE